MFPPFNEAFVFLNIVGKVLPLWLAVLVYLLFFIFLFVGQRFLFRFLRKKINRKDRPWLFLILQAIETSILLFLISGMLGCVPLLIHLPDSWGKGIALVAEFLTVLGFALFFQKLLWATYRRYLSSHASLRTYSTLIRLLISLVVYSIFLMIYLDTAGISITPLIASLGLGSVAIAFALQQTLTSLFAGIYLVTDQPIRVGDFVRLESKEEGFVDHIGWRSVHLRTADNHIIFIPNSKVAESLIKNYSLPEQETVLLIEGGVAYGSDLNKVEQIIMKIGTDVMKTVEGGMPAFEPVVRFHTLGDFGIRFVVVLKVVDFPSQALVKHEFIKRLLLHFQKEKIEVGGSFLRVVSHHRGEGGYTEHGYS